MCVGGVCWVNVGETCVESLYYEEFDYVTESLSHGIMLLYRECCSHEGVSLGITCGCGLKSKKRVESFCGE